MIPDFLYEKLKEEYPLQVEKIIEGYGKKRPTTFRVNFLRTTKEKVIEELDKNHFLYEELPSLGAFLLTEEKDIRATSLYQEGKIYLQSLSSMIPVLFLEPKAKESILDMASAPGGKTTQIASLTQDQALITACEKNPIRLERLKYNLEKQGVKRVSVLKEDARKLDSFFSFDKILLDAPCSGSGTIYLGEDTSYFQEDLVERLRKLQHELLEKAISLLKKGSTMIYSTCSILKEENEEILKPFLAQQKVEIVPLTLEGVTLLPTSIEGTLVVEPNERYEGFFIAKLRKKDI